MAVIRNFWDGRRVLVTGHTGFKGSWLTLWLSEVGAKVAGYALPPPTRPSLFEQGRLADRIQSTIGDIRDLPTLQRVVAEFQPEVIFHLAAQALVRASYAQPVDTFAVNVMGTTHLLEVARATDSVRAVVVVTTDKCYENREWAWGYREEDTLGGHDPYSASKACAELVASAYRRSFFRDRTGGISTARAGNVIGGGDWSTDRIVPDIARAALRGEAVAIRNPKSTRPWQHVLDVTAGYMLLAERLYEDPSRFGEAWNFGPAAYDVRTVEELATLLCARWGVDATWREAEGQQPHEARSLVLDSTKARSILGWTPKLDFAQAVEWSVDWYKAHRDALDLSAVSLAQIHRFLEMR